MKQFSSLQLVIVSLLTIMMLHSANASAKVYMGKITLQVGDEYAVSAVPTSGYTASGSFSKEGTCFAITANGSYYCTIKANYVGRGTLSYWGVVAPSGSWSTYTYDYYWDIEVKSSPIPVTDITLNTSLASMKVRETQQLTATVSPSNATDKSVNWSSSNKSVATVSSNGLVTAIEQGTATITCRANDGSGKQATCEISVSEAVTISINSTNFPDDNFRNYLLEQDYGMDGVLTGKEISEIIIISVESKDISSFKGIEYFTALQSLMCSFNQLSSLDVSKNTALTYLSCEINQLRSLDVSKNTALKYLVCYSNHLTSLDLSKNTALTKLVCGENQLTSLDLSKNTALTELRFEKNNIKGKAMDAVINSLPNNNSSEDHYFRAIMNPNPNIEYNTNVCTTTQVAAVKAKGWIPQCWSSGWVAYEGSEDTSIPTDISLPMSQTVEIGKTIQLTPTIVPAEAETTLTWTTDDETIAKVTSTGVVFGIKKGTAIITVTTDNELKAECFVTVQEGTGISIVNADTKTASVYTLSGQRLSAPKKGVNIMGGKKVVIK